MSLSPEIINKNVLAYILQSVEIVDVKYFSAGASPFGLLCNKIFYVPKNEYIACLNNNDDINEIIIIIIYKLLKR